MPHRESGRLTSLDSLPNDVLREVGVHLRDDNPTLTSLVNSSQRLHSILREQVEKPPLRSSFNTWCAERGYLKLLQWAREMNWGWDHTTTRAAAKAGHLHVFRWVLESHCDWDERCLLKAAKRGHLHILDWAHENGFSTSHKNLSSHVAAVSARAALHGHTDVLQWTHNKFGHRWGYKEFRNAARGGHLPILHELDGRATRDQAEEALSEATRYGHLHIVKYLMMRYGVTPNSKTLVEAASGGQLEMVKWLKEDKNCAWTPQVIEVSAASGHFDVMKYAYESNCPTDSRSDIITNVTRHGDLQMLEWARERKFAVNEAELALDAEKSGNRDLLRWVIEERYPWHASSGYFAAKSGSLEMLKYIYETKGELPVDISLHAIESRDLQTFKWVREVAGYRLNYERELWAALYSSGNERILRYIHAHEPNPRPFDAIDVLGASTFSALHYLRERGCKWDEDTASQALAKSVHISEWKLVLESGCPWDYRIFENLANCGDPRLKKWALQWMRSNGRCSSWECSLKLELVFFLIAAHFSAINHVYPDPRLEIGGYLFFFISFYLAYYFNLTLFGFHPKY